MRAKDADTITIRKTVTTSIKIERSSEKEESTAMPIIIVVLDAEAD